jgi:PAS domain S-box-containing protein
MEVSGRAFRMLFETAHALGIAPERIAAGLPFDVPYLTNTRNRIDWGTFLAANERVGELLGRDPERLRRLGERMLQMPSFSFMQRMARLLVSPQMLYDLGNRWMAPTLVPGVATPSLRVLPDGRLVIEAEMPVHPISAESYFHILTGNLRATPTLLGLPPATVDAKVGHRHLVATIRLPASQTLLERTRRSLMTLRTSHEVFDVLDAQRRELQEAFDTSLATHRTFRELLDNLPALVLIHREGTILWCNRTLVRALGRSHVEELVGRQVLEVTHPSSRDTVSAVMAAPVPAAGRGAASPPPTLVRLLGREGATITLEVAVPQSIDFDGPARMVVGVDVSARVALEQRLVTADRVASMGRLGAGVAHEINNPLAYSLNSVELAARQVAALPGAPPELGALLDTAIEGLGRVRTIVRDLRTLSRPDDGPPEPIDVQAILESSLTLAASALSGRARVVREYVDLPLASANGPRLAQVALNLILNASDAMSEPGEVRVRTLVDEAGRVAFEVQDTGTGIAPDVLAHIFDPFFTTKPIGRGTGLGLAICHQIVAGFGGEITVRSTVGRGSTFRVSLPVARAPAAASHGARASAERVRRRVFIVDDEPQLVRVIGRMLDAHEVASTSSPGEALERLRSEPLFDVVLCDLMMPGMTGMQLHDELLRVRPEIAERMVFMTGGAFTPEAREFLARVPNRCLEKPFTTVALEAELSRVGPASA